MRPALPVSEFKPKILAVVPARGGSKGIPRKNLQIVGDLSLVARAARCARECGICDAMVLSTDDEEIAAEGRAHGLAVPFMRTAELASDAASSVDMWRDAWLRSESAFDTRFDISVLLEPTSALRRPSDIKIVVDRLVRTGAAAAATFSATPAHFSPEKTLTVDNAGRVGFYLPDGGKYARRQLIRSYYHRNGLCYAVRRETLIVKGHIIEQDCAAVIVDRPVVNIDDPLELELARFLLTREGGDQ